MDANNEMPRTSLQKLNVRNYHLWYNKMEVIMRGWVLWRFVEAGDKAVSDDLAMMLKKDEEMSLLIMPTEDEYIATLIGLREPSNIWKALKEIKKATAEASVDEMIVQLQTIRMGQSEKIMRYVNRMTELEKK